MATIYGSQNNDTISGTTGNDIIHGEAGNDTYIYSYNYGHDVIYDTSGTSDIVLFQNVDLSDAAFSRYNNDLIITAIMRA